MRTKTVFYPVFATLLALYLLARVRADEHYVNGRKAVITIQADNRFAGDTLFGLVMSGMAYPAYNNSVNSTFPRRQYLVCLDATGHGRFELETDSGVNYFFLARDYNVNFAQYIPLIDFFPIEPGDDIRISIEADSVYPKNIVKGKDRADRKYRLTFSGNGHDKFDLYYKAFCDEERAPAPSTTEPIPIFDDSCRYNPDNFVSGFWKWKFNTVTGYKQVVGHQIWNLFEADLFGRYLGGLGRASLSFAGKCRGSESASGDLLKNLDSADDALDPYAKAHSKYYDYGVYNLEYAVFDMRFARVSIGFYDVLKKKYRGPVRDKLLTLFVAQFGDMVRNNDSLLTDAIGSVHTPYLKAKIQEIKRKEGGVKFSGFKLCDTSGKVVTEQDLKGKVVLMDFYFTGCSACKMLYRNCLKAVEDTFAGNGKVLFLAVSIDASKPQWLATVKAGLYSNTGQGNVLNLNTMGLGYKHPIIKYYNVNAYPCEILLDKNGRIAGFNKMDFRDSSALIAQVRQQLRKQDTPGAKSSMHNISGGL